ncbi:magnesium and cobalt efflux protein [Buchnera aphidicola (Nipponaphis monzeni)]|uniref:Magnesium and cobalt efflux protein CorC n=1 Tax=Buchnera aphidicola (Nipponaphis monzeni) TaxID=2495405 RepID=A0A455TAJ9_9GAMM|nr:CNNM family magnesium/cobalt transport protein CorC [Buchnera aphidicola]BBI01339.1 magnesium and cobalt efflux protein [Buchnera aphidicola (Nipponaphis monzeni)]
MKQKKIFSMLLYQLFYNEPKSKEDLLSLIRNLEKHELIDLDTKSMLEGVININKKRIKEIMIPRPQMVTLALNYSINQCIDTIIKSAHSRYPVMSTNKNYVKGIFMAKDLLPFMLNKSNTFVIKNILRPAIVVPESKYVHSMLKEFRLNRYHMAMVIDEFGAVSGLVTIEDILELIVGEIEDEYDNIDELNIRESNQNTFTIKGLTEIKEFNEFFNTSFNDTEVDTIGGFIMKAFGKLPKKGETIFINKYKFKILATDSRRIVQVQMFIQNK